MKRKTPCPRPRTLTAEEKAAGFFIDRYGWTCYRSPNPLVRLLDLSCSYLPFLNVTLWTFVSVGLFVAGFCLLGPERSVACILFICQGPLYLVFPLDRLYRIWRHRYFQRHGLPGPYGNGSLDRTPRGDAWLDQSTPDASQPIFDPTIPLLLLFGLPGLREAAAPSSAAPPASPSTSGYAYSDDEAHHADLAEDDAEARDDDGWTFDPFADDDDEMLCHMEDPDDPFL